MFWFLLFAHLLADFPLQSNWMVDNKDRTAVRLLHVLFHFLISLVFTLYYVPEAWPLLVLLASIHFLIDSGKNYVNRAKPSWIIFPYLFDQFLHVLSIILIATMITRISNVPPFAIQPVWLILSIVYLAVTYVWYISERTLTFRNKDYFQQVVDKEWPRMVARAVFLTVPIIMWYNTPKYFGVSALVFPYKLRYFGLRAFITDIIISGLGAIFFLVIVWF